jgi:hypothetical protein
VIHHLHTGMYGIHENRVKVRNQESVKADSTQTNNEKARSSEETGPQTHEQAIQAHHVSHQEKAVARWPNQSAGAPRCRRTTTGAPQVDLH